MKSPPGAARGSKTGGWYAHVHEDPEDKLWKSAFGAAVEKWRPQQPLEGPVSVRILAALDRPKRLMRKADPDGYCPIDAGPKPDCDNLAKLVLDALVDRGWFKGDDGQVARLDVVKVYTGKSHGAHLVVTIEPTEIPHLAELIAHAFGPNPLSEIPRTPAGPTDGKALSFAF